MSKEKRPQICKISIEFFQDGNTLGTTDEYENLTIDLEFQSGEMEGPFYVLKTTGWSIDEISEIQKLVDVAKAPLDKIKEEFPETKYEL